MRHSTLATRDAETAEQTVSLTRFADPHGTAAGMIERRRMPTAVNSA